MEKYLKTKEKERKLSQFSAELSIFSSETLDSLAMAELVGGDTNNCQGGNCGNCVTQCGCGSNYAVCAPINIASPGCIVVTLPKLATSF